MKRCVHKLKPSPSHYWPRAPRLSAPLRGKHPHGGHRSSPQKYRTRRDGMPPRSLAPRPQLANGLERQRWYCQLHCDSRAHTDFSVFVRMDSRILRPTARVQCGIGSDGPLISPSRMENPNWNPASKTAAGWARERRNASRPQNLPSLAASRAAVRSGGKRPASDDECRRGSSPVLHE